MEGNIPSAASGVSQSGGRKEDSEMFRLCAFREVKSSYRIGSLRDGSSIWRGEKSVVVDRFRLVRRRYVRERDWWRQVLQIDWASIMSLGISSIGIREGGQGQ